MEITIGMKGEASTLVEREDTAAEVGSGDLLVYATPCMAALMEGAACEAIAPALAEGTTSVGTMLANGKAYLSTDPYIIMFPALFISLLEVSFNLFGNGLRDAFNPSLRGVE